MSHLQSDHTVANQPAPLTSLTAGMPVIVGGDRVVHVDAALAGAFRDGDALLVVGDTGQLLHLPAAERDLAATAVTRAFDAFVAMAGVDDLAISRFYASFADRLADDDLFGPIAVANRHDLDRALELGRSTTRLALTEAMRADMIEGLRIWETTSSGRGDVEARITHSGWSATAVRDGLGVVAFVFEGRPNVFADATGVLRSGNTVVFRIGSDALGTAQAMVDHALAPALKQAGLPPGAVTLLDSPTHAAGWAMFADPRLGLAVARGSGPAVAQLGAIARGAGNQVSLHGTGGAWLVATAQADRDRLVDVVAASLDRKVCNTLNTAVATGDGADWLVPAILEGLARAADQRGVPPRLHVRAGDDGHVDPSWFDSTVTVKRANGNNRGPKAEVINPAMIGHEWEWEDSPELTLVVADDLDDAVALCNAHSPRFVASLISEASVEQDRFFATVDAPFVGNGFTRWVDGQYALAKPELGLSNWEFGRLFARGGILSGDSVHTLRLRMDQVDPGVTR